MEKGTVSVVIPVYNCERYIVEAVESALAQTRPAEEILVIDDGSTDGTRHVLEPLMNRIRYIYQPNAGEPTARNVGIERAKCEYIAFLDADDLWRPEKLQMQLDYFASHPECGLVYTDITLFDETGVIEESIRKCRNLTYPSGYVFERLFHETLFQTSCAVFRKECISKVGGFDPSLFVGSDYDVWLRIARNFQLGYVDAPLVLYRQHAAMATRNLGKAMHEDMPWEVFILKKILTLYPEATTELGQARVDHRLSVPYFSLAYEAVEEGNFAAARRLLTCAIKYWPTNLRYRAYFLMTFLRPSQFWAARSLYRRFRRSPGSIGVNSHPRVA